MTYSTMEDMDFHEKRVLIRTGFDIPVDNEGAILDDKRIEISIPTIKNVLEQGARRVILMWHMGRPKSREDRLSTGRVCERLSEVLNMKVTKLDDWGESGIPTGKLFAFENLRFHEGEKSKDEAVKKAFAEQLASSADIYINDAFSNSHRDHASMTYVPRIIPGCMGLSVQKEMDTLIGVLKNPHRPVVSIFGGLKADKINAMHNLLSISEYMIVGGALAFLMLKAKGFTIGKSKVDDEGLENARDTIHEMIGSKRVLLPIDCVIADRFAEDAQARTVDVDMIDPDWMALDIGPKSLKKYKAVLESAKTILWFGPIGVFEFKKFSEGTREIAMALAKSSATTIIGGGDSANAVDSLRLAGEMDLVSTGGGASLRIAEGKSLPAIEVLRK